MIAIVDYGVGNLFSLKSSLSMIGQEAYVTGDIQKIRRAERIILPGVGAFGDAMEKLRRTGLTEFLQEEAAGGKYILGICLGMQMLFTESLEFGRHEGLGLIRGRVIDMRSVVSRDLKIPQIGWNALHLTKPEHPLWKYIHENDHAYFVHSFYATECEESVLATTEYGAEITAAVGSENILGCQFHPEKSGKTGLSILKAFCEMR